MTRSVAKRGEAMATAAVVAALDQQAVIDAFMRTDTVRPAQAIVFEPSGPIQRGFFRGFTKAGIIKPEGARWYLDVPAYSAARRSKRKKTIAVAAVLAVAAGLAALL